MSGITAIPLVSVIATILSVEAHHARVDAGLVEGIRPDDSAIIYYTMPVDGEEKKVIVNRGIVVQLDDHSSVLRVDAEFFVLPGYSVEFEIPVTRVSPTSILELTRSRLMANRSNESLRTLIDIMVPEDEFIEQQVLQLIADRRKRRGVESFSTRPDIEPERAPVDQPEVSAEMAAVVREWAQAWSDQRVEDYLAFYSRGFLPTGGAGRSVWEAQRRRRVSRPSFIKLELHFLKSRLIDASRGWIEFEQSYWSDTFRDTVVKRLELIHEEGGWRILQERVGS
ncbi:MAG: hypothetical protein AAF657_12015 [Acidobacteriota bacterium]